MFLLDFVAQKEEALTNMPGTLITWAVGELSEVGIILGGIAGADGNQKKVSGGLIS